MLSKINNYGRNINLLNNYAYVLRGFARSLKPSKRSEAMVTSVIKDSEVSVGRKVKRTRKNEDVPELYEPNKKPVYLKTRDELENDTEVYIHQSRAVEILKEKNMDLEMLRKEQDKHYEVDVEYEVKRDLYEKQRVIDKVVKQNPEDNRQLNSFYENTYKKSRMNESTYFLYTDAYDMGKVRKPFFSSIGCTLLATATLCMIHPILAVLLVGEYYKIGRMANIFNSTCQIVGLASDKKRAYVLTYNFLGLEKKFELTPELVREIKYKGEYVNNYFNVGDIGLLPSMGPMMRYNTDQNSKFRYFHKFMMGNKKYLIPKDHKNKDEFIVDEQLLLDVISGNFRKVVEYDYSMLEQIYMEEFDKLEEHMKDLAESKGKNIEFEKDYKKRAYSYYHPTRDFETDKERYLKKFDDGTYTDNGYR